MKQHDLTFEIAFLEGVLRRDRTNIRVVEALGELYNRCGRLDDGLRMDRRLVRLTPDSATAHYNLACSLALKHRYPEAAKALREAVTRGFDDIHWILEDPDLRQFRRSSAFRSFCSDFEIAVSEPRGEPMLVPPLPNSEPTDN